VRVIRTDTYKHRFDNRKGGAGYEGHIITGEIINEVGENKFIPVLRCGDWKTAMPTALSGVYGVDLRNDLAEEYAKLIDELGGLSDSGPDHGEEVAAKVAEASTPSSSSSRRERARSSMRLLRDISMLSPPITCRTCALWLESRPTTKRSISR